MSQRQQSLFDNVTALPPAAPELVELGRRVPPTVKFGTSTWTYDGWAGDVYHRSYRGAQPARRLEEYARYPLFRTVGIDSAYYEPPEEPVLAAYAQALPPGFPCVSKVWDRITAKRLDQRVNPDFLNADLFKDAVLGPYERAFRDHAGCFVFEFQAMRGKDLPDPARWAGDLDGFLRQLPRDFRYAVELRNRELLTDTHGAVLARHGVAHVFNSWTAMPTLGEQLELPWTFPAPFPPPRPELVALAAALPPGIKFGTASWTEDGWAGEVYQRSYRGAQPAARLEEYVRYPLFRTVGINSAFYESPSERILDAYARALPDGYSCVVKVWDRITARRFIRDRRWGDLAGQRNPDFLDARLFLDSVLARYQRVLHRQSICFVFQFQAMRGADLLRDAEWAERLDRFFAQLPKEFRYAVELRNAELLTDRHGEVLARHGVAHVFNSWTEMPPIGTQLHLPWTLAAGFTLARALMKPGRKYAEAVRAFAPYDRVREGLPELRRDLLCLTGEAPRRGIEALHP